MLSTILMEYLKAEALRVEASLDRREEFISVYTPIFELERESEVFAIFEGYSIELRDLIVLAEGSTTLQQFEEDMFNSKEIK